jgi:hypothetical protein
MIRVRPASHLCGVDAGFAGKMFVRPNDQAGGNIAERREKP